MADLRERLMALADDAYLDVTGHAVRNAVLAAARLALEDAERECKAERIFDSDDACAVIRAMREGL